MMIVNTKIIANPYNWVIVLAFIVIGVALFRELGRLFEQGYPVTTQSVTGA